MRRMRGPFPGCSATRCPARLKPLPSTHVVLNPRASSSLRKRSPTARTPARLCVPLLMLTALSSSASASALPASTAVTIARSGAAEICAARIKKPSKADRIYRTPPAWSAYSAAVLPVIRGLLLRWGRGQRDVGVAHRVRNPPVAARVLLEQHDILAAI